MAAILSREFAIRPSTNRNGQAVTVTVAFETTCVVLCLLIRLYMRWPWRKLLALSDYLAVVATVRTPCKSLLIDALLILRRCSPSAMPLPFLQLSSMDLGNKLLNSPMTR